MIVHDDSISYVQAAEIIADGGVIAFRTDTFYGLGADPLNGEAVRKIRALKGREDDKPILILVKDLGEVDRFISYHSELYNKVASRVWPGPITLIGVARPELPVELTAGTGTLGVRLPNDDNLRALLHICGGALTATSANVSGSEPARNVKDVENYFPNGIDLIIDGGEVTATQPSTILDLSGAAARLVREGAIPREDLEDLL
jgi:L-threonylcarbamoyladenylate synthase